MTWLVTGGAGYIGAHVVAAMRDGGERVVVLDDLSTGDPRRIAGVPLVEGSVLDVPLVERTMREHAISGVVHIAEDTMPLITWAARSSAGRPSRSAMAATMPASSSSKWSRARLRRLGVVSMSWNSRITSEALPIRVATARMPSDVLTDSRQFELTVRLGFLPFLR